MIDLAIKLVGQARVRAVPRRHSLHLRWLLAAVVTAAAGFAWFSSTGSPVRMDPDLVRVLQLMGFLKAGLVAAALAVLYWRLGWAMTPQLVGAYFAGVAMVVAASVWIWLANHVAIAGLLFHLGILVLAIAALRDGRGSVPLTPRGTSHDLRPSRFRSMRVELDDLSRAEVRALLREHVDDMYEITPPESVHALDLDELRAADVTFWTVWEGGDLLGCGALRELNAAEGEIKTMRTPARKRRRGAGRAILEHMVTEARARGYERLYLETGSMAAFAPARGLYESAGFVPCGPFGPYHEDPNLFFMTLSLGAAVSSAQESDSTRP